MSRWRKGQELSTVLFNTKKFRFGWDGDKKEMTKETEKKQPVKWPGDLVWCPGRPVKEEYQEGASDSSLP